VEVCPDYEDLFKIFNSHGIKYLLAGGQAVIYYTEPRYTKDIDVWVIPEINDSDAIFKALKEFGAPLTDVSREDFSNKELIIQIGLAPVRIDILFDIEGVTFGHAWKNRKRVRYGKTSIFIMGLNDLIRAKKKAGRAQDVLDLEKLQKIKTRKLSSKAKSLNNK